MQAYEDRNGARFGKLFSVRTYDEVVAKMDKRREVVSRQQLTKNQAKRLRKKGVPL